MAQGTPAGPGPRSLRRWLPLLLIILLVALFFLFGLQRYVSLTSLRTHHEWLAQEVAAHLPLALLAFVSIYVAVVALSLPGATVLTLAGGWMFGQWLGTAATVVAATAGATLLFLAAHTAFGDSLRRRAGPWLRRLQEGFQADAFNYLLFLRLVPLFPFFVVNLVPAVIGVPLRTFVLATVIGIIPATFVFATFGAGLGDLLAGNGEITLGHVLSPLILTALAGLALLALLPVLHRHWRRRQKPHQGQSTGGSK
jgi:uncharacterized membrane protein YdjX (TVP38/TMEM64 family)